MEALILNIQDIVFSLEKSTLLHVHKDCLCNDRLTHVSIANQVWHKKTEVCLKKKKKMMIYSLFSVVLSFKEGKNQ